MLRNLLNVGKSGRTGHKLIILGLLLLLLLAVVYRDTSTPDSPGKSSGPFNSRDSSDQQKPRESSEPLKPTKELQPIMEPQTVDMNQKPGPKCFCVSFSQEELEKTCIRGSNPALCRLSKVDHLDHSEFNVARLRHPTGHISMIVHPAWDMISMWLLKIGAWEEGQTNFIRSALELLPGAGLLDVGSQLGVYSLHAAQMGRHAVAIDAFYQNSIRLFASVKANGFQDRVRVYWNALALKSNGKMNMNIGGDCNIGGQRPSEKNQRKSTDPIDVRTATLDKIVIGDGCFSGVTQLVVKADIEGAEWLVTATGADVFKRFNVSVVMMEWVFVKTNSRAAEVVKFFLSHRLLLHGLSGTRLQPLDSGDFPKWPWDVIWATKEFAAQKV